VLVEWLAPGTQLVVEIHLDEYLFAPQANRILHFAGAQEAAVRDVAAVCNRRARAIVLAEKTFFAELRLDTLHAFYGTLEGMLNDLGPGSFVLNLGWGGGWEAKTVGRLLRQALGEERWQELRQQFGLGRKPTTGRIDWQAPFPKSRRVAYDRGRAAWPMGWVLLRPPGQGGPVKLPGPAVATQAQARAIGAPVSVKILARHEKGPKSSFFVQEEGQARGLLCHGTPPATLPEIGDTITVYVSSLDLRSPQYRWDPAPPPSREPWGRGPKPGRRG
jgi:hypothetical protein